MIYTIPMSFYPSVSFCPRIILPPPIILPPWKWFNDLCYLSMSRIILPLCRILCPPGIILPPRNGLMIYAIYPCPISFFPSIILPPYQFPPPPHHFAPWKWFNDLCYLPMSRIILPPPPPWIHIILPPEIFCTLFTHVPYNFAPVSFPPPPVSFCPHRILPPGNCFMIYTISPCPVSFCPLDSFCPYLFAPYHFAPWKWFNDLHYLLMSRIILPPVLDFVFILIKSPLQLKLMTGAHPVTVAPLVNLTLILCPCHKMAGEQRWPSG